MINIKTWYSDKVLAVKKVGFKIRYYRKIVGLNQSQLAEYVGLSRVSICNIEKGKQDPPIYKLARICAILNITPNDLLKVPSFKIRYNSNKEIEILWNELVM